MKKELTKISIDISYCDGCGACAELCPSNVFDIRELNDTEYKKLSRYQKFWVLIKGRKKSIVAHQEDCTHCRKCVNGCHEKAIKIRA